jgi:hypothetical protein
MYKIDLTGRKFNSWTVLGFSHTEPGGKHYWNCQCSCGARKQVESYNLTSSRSKSCRPCSAFQVAQEHHKTHGQSRTKAYRAWQSMKTRCYNAKQSNTYKHHGAIGVKVWVGWQSDFTAFYLHIGEPPTPLHTVDRIDPFGDYAPGNVRWATQSEQMNNTRRSKAVLAKRKLP